MFFLTSTAGSRTSPVHGLWRTIAACAVVLLLTAAPAHAEDRPRHVVREGENLTALTRRYRVKLSELIKWNDLKTDVLPVGRKLWVGPPIEAPAEAPVVAPTPETALPVADEAAVHVVAAGESLTLIARRRGVTIEDLRRINELSGDRILIGQKLRLREVPRTVHIVESGDALWEIARAYGIPLAELKQVNGLKSDLIVPGQELKLTAAAAAVIATYRVKRGDSLSEIARLHQMSLRELKDLNGLERNVIHPGQTLKVRPRPGKAGAGLADTISPRAAFNISSAEMPPLPAENGPYYFGKPVAGSQRTPSYGEKMQAGSTTDYRRARRLWEGFMAAVDAAPSLGRELDGWHIVIDPGHGGIDPGTIVRALDEDGREFYIVEDEYVYDMALRLAMQLRRHGAGVTLTVLSPDHLLRGNEPAEATFVHVRNEVINDPAWNRGGGQRDYPMGGQHYLKARVGVAREALKGVPADRQIFLSLHADNVPALGDVMTIFYQESSGGLDIASREFARRLVPSLGAGARARGKNLGILRNNPVRKKLLIEVRNLAFADHIWGIRYEELRQRDAEKIAQALINHVNGN